MKIRSTPFEIGAAIAVTITSAALVIIGTRGPVEPPEPPEPVVETVVVEKTVEVPAERPRIDVVFVLDTTGSMTSLIEGAKRKIWSVANRLASGTPQPEIRIGLVAYRDVGDAYITQAHPLNGDIDAVYQQLSSLRAEGGGDTREHVNKALNDAIHGMQWGEGENVLKLVFLVGDAAPHDDYSDVPTSAELAAHARDKGILLNTIRCGYDRETEESWKRIASLAGGQYTSIAQSGGMVDVATPFDGKLRDLNAELADTVMNYGSAADKSAGYRKLATRKAMAAPSAAAAASYSAKSGRLNKEDLVGALDAGAVSLESLSEEEMPDELRGKSTAERKAAVKKQRSARARIKGEILELSKQRDAFISEKNTADGAAGFDGEVVDMLREQASSIGVAY